MLFNSTLAFDCYKQLQALTGIQEVVDVIDVGVDGHLLEHVCSIEQVCLPPFRIVFLRPIGHEVNQVICHDVQQVDPLDINEIHHVQSQSTNRAVFDVFGPNPAQ